MIYNLCLRDKFIDKDLSILYYTNIPNGLKLIENSLKYCQ